MTKDQVKHAIVSLLVGVLVGALTQLLEGFVHILNNWAAPASGGVVGAITYAAKHFRV